MKRRNLVLVILLTIALMFTCFNISFAEPSQLIVVRASDNSLWKATCQGTTCTGFTSFPGLFTSQPAVLWDEDIQRYVLWGRGTDGAIWRSTFSRTGTFNNDWTVPIPGSTASPPGASGGGIVNNFNSAYPIHGSVTVSTTVTNIDSLGVTAPMDGFFQCIGTGQMEFSRSSATGDVWTWIYITDTSGGTESWWSLAALPNGTPAGITIFPWAIQTWFNVSAGSHTFYITAQEGGSASGTTTTDAYDSSMSCVFFPYAY